MARQILANQSTAAKRRVYFHLVDATDGITPETGEASGQPQVSSDGGAWTNTGIGTLNSIGNGRYYAELTQTLVQTAGVIIETRYKSANTAEAPGDQVHVVAYDPDSATLGMTIPSATTIAEALLDHALSGHTTAGTAGEAIGRLDGTITSRAAASTALSNATWTDTKAGYVDAAISSRSTYAGGAVASVTGAVGSVTAVVSANVTQINGSATNGNNATLSLKALSVVNDNGDAIVAGSSGGNGRGIYAYGNGTGHGLASTGGATGAGAQFVGGATSGAAINAINTSGDCITVTPTSGNALTLTASSAGTALNCVGGTSAGGKGAYLSGYTSGIYVTGNGGGIYALAAGNSPNAHGITAIGSTGSGSCGIVGQAQSGGTNAGIKALGGAGTNARGFWAEAPNAGIYSVALGTNAHGAEFIGGSTSGSGIYAHASAGNSDGITALGTGTGHGIKTTGGGTGGSGIESLGGASGGSGIRTLGTSAGDGLRVTGGASGSGIAAYGGGTVGHGLYAKGGGTGGHGIYANGSSTTGNGILAIAPASGHGIECVATASVGAKHGISTTGSATGSGLLVVGGATSGAAISATNTSGDCVTIAAGGGNGDAVSLAGNGTGHGLASTGGTTGNGATFTGGATSGTGLSVAGGAGGGDAIKAFAGAAGGSGLNVKGYGAIAAVNVTQAGTGEGVHFEGGVTSGPALAILSNDDNAVEIMSFGVAHDGIVIEVDGSGDALSLIGGASGAAISATNSTGDCVTITSGGGNGDAVKLTPNGSGYGIDGTISGNITGNLSGSVGSVTGNVGGNVSGSVNNVANPSGIADAVWDEATADHQTAGTTGLALTSASAPTAAAVADAVWDELLSGHTAAGSAGEAEGRLDATVSSRSTYSGGAVASVTGNVGGSVASVTGAVGSVAGNVGGNVVGSVGSVAGDVSGKVLGGGASALVGPAVLAYDALGNAIAPAATALSTATWTAPRAAALDLIDVASSTLATPADILASETAIRGVDGDTLKTLSDQLDGVYSPSGLHQVTIVVSDQFAATVENMQVAIYDNANLVLLRRGVTDSLGRYTVAIDNGNYKVRLSAHWYDATVPENLVVAGDMTQAYSVTAWVPSPPAAATLCVIYGTIIDASGVAVPNAAVRFKTILPAVFDNITQASGTQVEATTDLTGYFEAQLVRNAVVSVKVPACGIDATRTVPDAVSQEFTAWEDDD